MRLGLIGLVALGVAGCEAHLTADKEDISIGGTPYRVVTMPVRPGVYDFRTTRNETLYSYNVFEEKPRNREAVLTVARRLCRGEPKSVEDSAPQGMMFMWRVTC